MYKWYMGAVYDKFSFYFLVKGSSAQGGIAGPSNACNCPEIAFVGNEIISLGSSLY